MSSPFPKPKTCPDFIFRVTRGVRKVERVRVIEVARGYARVVHPNGRRHRESWKSRYHEYFYYYSQAKIALQFDLEKLVETARATLTTLEADLRAVSLTNEEDL